jgi:hypothetical protein
MGTVSAALKADPLTERRWDHGEDRQALSGSAALQQLREEVDRVHPALFYDCRCKSAGPLQSLTGIFVLYFGLADEPVGRIAVLLMHELDQQIPERCKSSGRFGAWRRLPRAP